MPDMVYRVLFLAAYAVLFGCSGAQSNGAYQNVPYCPEGNRARGCITGKVCSVSSQGCQVCRCERLDE
jgi:hypothetical protein